MAIQIAGNGVQSLQQQMTGRDPGNQGLCITKVREAAIRKNTAGKQSSVKHV